MQQSNELLFKLLVVGDMNTGKTCLVRKYVHGIFYTGTRPTVGVDFAIKALTYKENTCTLQLWDIAGQERYRNMTRTFYQNAVGAVVVVDITNKATLKAAELWKQDIDAKVFVGGTNNPLPVMLLLNKCDLGEGEVGTNAEIEEFVSKNKFVGWMKVSAQDGTNVNEAFEKMIGNMIDATRAVNNNNSGAAGGSGGAAQPAAVQKVNFGAKKEGETEQKPAGKKCDC